MFNIISPLEVVLFIGKCGIRYGFAEMYADGLSFLFVHFINEIKHFDICLDTQFFSDIREAVKKVGIMA